METSGKPIANPVSVLREEFDDWAVLFNPDTAEAVGVSPVGVAIWKLLDGYRDLDQIVAEVQDQFVEVPDTVDQEVMDFIQDLADRGFVGYEVHPVQK